MSGSLRMARAPWYATPIVALSVLVGLHGLVDMVEYSGWVWTAAGLLGVVALCVAVTRMLSRSRFLPTAVGLVAAVLVAAPAFAVAEDGSRFTLPTPSALRALVTALGDGVHEAATKVPPADVERPLLALLMAGVFALFLVAEHLAVSWRAAAVSGVVLLLPWIPAIALQHRLTLRLLLAAIVLWIVLLAVTKRPTGASDRPAPFAGGVAAVAAVGLTLLVAPTALGGNGWGMIPRLATPDQFETAPRLNLALDLRNSLTVNTSSTVAVYVSSGARPDALRLYTLAEFDGTSWSASPDPMTRPLSTAPLWPTPVLDWESRELDTLSFSVRSSESSLPLPTVPRSVGTLDGTWGYAQATDQVLSDTSTTANMEYTVTADLGYFSPDLLRAAGDAQDALVDPSTLALPEGVDAERFRALATDITAGSATRFDQAVALQEHFRNKGGYTYDTTVQPEGSDSVSVFLDNKRGYCVQFATSMVMLSRSLGIPARLAVGYLPGNADESGAYVVRGGDAHAWPELYFSDVGWVRFEPTPSVQTGVRPSYTQDAAQGGDGVDDNTNPTARPDQAGPTMGPIPVPTSQPSGAAGDEEATGVPWLLIIAFAVLAALALATAALVARRRREEADRATDPEVAWSWLRKRVDPAYTWPLALTPHEVREFVVSVAAADGVEIDDDALASLEALALAVSDHRYAPDGSLAVAHELDRHAERARDGIAGAAAEATGRPLRAGARGALRRGA